MFIHAHKTQGQMLNSARCALYYVEYLKPKTRVTRSHWFTGRGIIESTRNTHSIKMDPVESAKKSAAYKAVDNHINVS